MKIFIKSIIILVFLGFILPSVFAQKKCTITIKIEGIKNRSGKIYAGLKNDPNNFLGEGTNIKSVSTEVTKEGDVILKFEGVFEGKYAIAIYQDLNDNKILDMNGQIPAEPFGFSNVTMLMGPPNFEQCAFDLTEDKAISIGLFIF